MGAYRVFTQGRCTYNGIKRDRGNPRLFPHRLLERCHLTTPIVRGRKEAVHGPRNDTIRERAIPRERTDVRPGEQVQEDGAEEEDLGVGVGERPAAATRTEHQHGFDVRRKRALSHTRKYTDVNDNTVKIPVVVSLVRTRPGDGLL